MFNTGGDKMNGKEIEQICLHCGNISVGGPRCGKCRERPGPLDKLPADHRVIFLDGPRESTKLAIDLTPMKAMRAKCMDCSGGNAGEVRRCVIPNCPLYPFRTGKRPVFEGHEPKRRTISEEHKAKLHGKYPR